MKKSPSPKVKDPVLEQVSRIPSGCVVTYGDIANHLGIVARTVGWVMAGLSEEEMTRYPWHRVVGAGGTIPALKYGFRGQVQINLLKDEGLEFTESLKIKDFARFRFEIN